MMNKVLNRVLTVLQVLFLIAAWGIQYFSMKKMGMMRYVVFINREWEGKYPIDLMQYAAIAFLTLVLIVIVLFVKTKKDRYLVDKKFLRMLIIQVIFTLAFVFFTLAYSTESYRSYYFISIILGITALIQDIKILVSLGKPVTALD